MIYQWWLCPRGTCPHGAILHDVEEYRGDGTETCCVDGCDCGPMTCPTCDGAGIVDTSPPGVETAPWLATDTDCPRCGGEGEMPEETE